MGREIIVSSGDALRRISLEDWHEAQRVPLERAGALCVSKDHVYCACGNAIWQLDRKCLTPSGLFGGGSGMCSLMLSPDRERLFALCGEADSVLMMSAKDGRPLLLNRAGVNPRGMALDGDILAVSGGESGMVLIFCAHSLQRLEAFSMPGPVYSAALKEGTVYALCLTAELSSLLVAQKMGGMRSVLALDGMPGCLLIRENDLLAATDHALYIVSLDGERILRQIRFLGRTVWMADTGEETLLLDGYTESLFAAGRHDMHLIARQTAYAALDWV